jgi:hypothetical protein
VLLVRPPVRRVRTVPLPLSPEHPDRQTERHAAASVPDEYARGALRQCRPKYRIRGGMGNGTAVI